MDQVDPAFQRPSRGLCPRSAWFGMVTCEPEPAERLTQGTRYESGADAQRYG